MSRASKFCLDCGVEKTEENTYTNGYNKFLSRCTNCHTEKTQIDRLSRTMTVKELLNLKEKYALYVQRVDKVLEGRI